MAAKLVSLKRTVRRALAGAAPTRSAPGIRVLMYHAIDDPIPADRLSLRVGREQFLEQMTILRDEGHVVVPLASIPGSGAADGPCRVAITFDDGYQSQAWAAGVLRRFGFPATFFLVPRFLDGHAAADGYWESWGFLRWDDAKALAADGFEIGAHSAAHVDLTRCDDECLEREVAVARERLHETLHTEVVSFSYPFGRHDARVRRAVARAGYGIACTSRYGLNRTSVDRFAVRRTEVTGSDSALDFRRKIRGQYDCLGYWQAIASTRG